MPELKLFIKFSWKCLLTALLNWGLPTKKGIEVLYTDWELNASSIVIIALHIVSVFFRIKNEPNPLAVGQFSSFPGVISKSILSSTYLNVQLVATLICISLNMVYASGLLSLLRSLIIVWRTVCSNLFIFSTISSHSNNPSKICPKQTSII